MNHISNERPEPDDILVKIADYVIDYKIENEEALKTSRLCLMDSIACALIALNYPACTKLLGPIVPEIPNNIPFGVRIPGTKYILDPVQGAFNIGMLIRWLDFNDTWLAAEWGHPSDNLGAILALGDYCSQKGISKGESPIFIKDILSYLVKTHEIQGVIALINSFNKVGLDHVVLVKVASTAVATKMLGGNKNDIINAVSQAWIDGQSLRTYRHSPNTGTRKSWAAGDATSRAVKLALLTLRGEMGYPSALTAKTWGFYDVLFKGKSFIMEREFSSYVMENVLFKISFPAEFHAQTAVECAVKLYPEVYKRLDDIEKIVLHTHESAIRIIDKTGPLHNPADRDHCIQYMTSIGLIFGNLEAKHYEDEFSKDSRIDLVRAKITIIEDPQYSIDYLDPKKRSIANAVQVFFKDGSSTGKAEVQYPLGHRFRRQEGIPKLIKKFENAVHSIYPKDKAYQIIELCMDEKKFEETPINNFMKLLSL